jgi:prefoldin subunit 5
MSDAAEYQSMQEQLRRLHQEVAALAADIAADAEAFRALSEAAAAVGDRRTLSFRPVIDSAIERSRNTTTETIRMLIEKLQALELAQAAAAECYERLPPEERVGQIPASPPPQ